MLLCLAGCIKNPDINASESKEIISSVTNAENEKSAINTIISGEKNELTISSIASERDLRLYDQGG